MIDKKEIVKRVRKWINENQWDDKYTCQFCVDGEALDTFLDSLSAETDAEEKKHPDEYTPDDNPRLWRATMEACACGGKPPEDRAMCPACRVWHLWCGRDVAKTARKTCGNCKSWTDQHHFIDGEMQKCDLLGIYCLEDFWCKLNTAKGDNDGNA